MPAPSSSHLPSPAMVLRAALAACLLVMFLFRPALGEVRSHTLAVDGYPISIEYAPDDEKVARKIGDICERSIPRLAEELGLKSVGAFRVVVIGDFDSFQREQGVRLPAWGVAFALMDSQVMLVDVKRATMTWDSLDRVIPHELSHLLLAQRLVHAAMPLWFVEGLAMWQAREWSLLESWRLMEAVWTNRAPGIGQIYTAMPPEESQARDAYRVAYAAFAARFDEHMERLPGFLDAIDASGSFATAFQDYWGDTEAAFYAGFQQDLERRYRSRLLLFQAGPLFSVIAVLFLFVYVRIRIRNRQTLQRFERMERGLGDSDR